MKIFTKLSTRNSLFTLTLLTLFCFKHVKAENETNSCHIAPTENEIRKGKVLTAKQMYIVSAGIYLQPSFMVTAWFTKESAKQVLNAVNKVRADAAKNKNDKLFSSKKNETVFVQKQLKILLKCLANFLSPLRGFGGIVIPLMEESLLDPAVAGNNTTPAPHSIFIKLFNTDTSISIETFFANEVQNIVSLAQICSECVIFFNDLYESLTEGARQSFDNALVTKLDSLKKARTSQKNQNKNS